jgi:hypothetical protein
VDRIGLGLKDGSEVAFVERGERCGNGGGEGFDSTDDDVDFLGNLLSCLAWRGLPEASTIGRSNVEITGCV